ncbi:MAG: DUF1573 domain-containing protein [Bacteroidota bacterium]
MSRMKPSLFSVLTLAIFCLLFSCESAPADAPTEAVDALGPNAAIIRSPVDQGTDQVDSSKLARMAFSSLDYNFGEVRAGAEITHQFPFTNDGGVPLLITQARSSCGCTVSEYPEEPIAPGESGAVSVVFNTKNKSGGQRKAVTITANTYPATTTIYMTGTVTE